MLGRLSRWVGRFALDLLLTPVDLVVTVVEMVAGILAAASTPAPEEWRRLARPRRVRVVTDVTKDGRRQWHTVEFITEHHAVGYAAWCAEQKNMHRIRLRRGQELLGSWEASS